MLVSCPRRNRTTTHYGFRSDSNRFLTRSRRPSITEPTTTSRKLRHEFSRHYRIPHSDTPYSVFDALIDARTIRRIGASTSTAEN